MNICSHVNDGIVRLIPLLCLMSWIKHEQKRLYQSNCMQLINYKESMPKWVEMQKLWIIPLTHKLLNIQRYEAIRHWQYHFVNAFKLHAINFYNFYFSFRLVVSFESIFDFIFHIKRVDTVHPMASMQHEVLLKRVKVIRLARCGWNVKHQLQLLYILFGFPFACHSDSTSLCFMHSRNMQMEPTNKTMWNKNVSDWISCWAFIWKDLNGTSRNMRIRVQFIHSSSINL